MWLNSKRYSTDGWADITDDDVEELWCLIDGLIHLKCAEDADGAVPIEFILVDRTKYERLHFSPVAYDHEVETEAEHLEILRRCSSNAGLANDRLSLAIDIDRRRRKREIMAEEAGSASV